MSAGASLARTRRCAGEALAIVALAGASRICAQVPDSVRCDSIVASKAAVVDSVPSAVFLSVAEVQSNWMTDDQRDLITARIATLFAPPSPFRLSVFEGPALTRGLRISARGDSLGVPRAASVTGTYRLQVTEHGATDGPDVVRSSLLPGLDSAMIRAISAASRIGTAFRPVSGDRWRLEIRVTGDSLEGSRRLAQGTFPRLRVRDAAPSMKIQPTFPENALAAGLDHGEVVLRFVVDHAGLPALETVEIVRASAVPFARAALAMLSDQKFSPATIRGCPVAQLVEFPFIFDAPQRPPPPSR